ncbi:heat shock 70 kDa protein 14 isoform X2 [Narcine bancroftii]|uniref:heat shock 70 kDa protein 14 isoform X2 n=1 Tax=Narcine bancroftii TaxID=1343680 RepID=UPI00383211BB
MAAIGVHLGGTSSCVAVCKDGRADVVANDSGDRVTPAVVAYRENEKVVGLAAKQGRIRNASNTVVKVKQILGRCFEDPQVQKHVAESKCSVINKDGKPRYGICTGEELKVICPEDVMQLIFEKMKETAQSALGSDVNNVVITVPLDFDNNQKNVLRQAAQAAGFNVLRLIHEPSAALLAFGIGQEAPLGKRARFESLCATLFSQSIQPVQKLVEEAGISRCDISKVVLCGGSARIPKLQQMIRDLFPDVDLLNSIPPDEVIAVGAAIQAALLSGKESIALEEDALIVECSARNILAKETDESGSDSYTVVFPSGTPLPARRQHVFQAPGTTSSVCLELYQSGAKGCERERDKVAQIVLRDLQRKGSGSHEILAVLTMKRDGSLHVTCTEQGAGISEAVTLEVGS